MTRSKNKTNITVIDFNCPQAIKIYFPVHGLFVIMGLIFIPINGTFGWYIMFFINISFTIKMYSQ